MQLFFYFINIFFFYDVVATYVNLKQVSCSCRHNSVNSDIFHIDFTVAFQMQRWKYFHK